MRAKTRPSIAAAALLTLAAAASPSAVAQQWSVVAGAASRIEYTDNYYFVASDRRPAAGPVPATADDPETAITLSVIPFAAVVRRTEVSDLSAILAVGANKVWGPSPSQDDLSGRFEMSGSLRDLRSTWGGTVSFARATTRESAIRETEVVRALAYTNSAQVAGSYSYALTERWSVSAAVGGYLDRYDGVEGGGDTFADDRGFNVSGRLRYQLDAASELVYSLSYSSYDSDVSRNDIVGTAIGVVYQYSPQLRISASLGGHWSRTEARNGARELPVTLAAGDRRTDGGANFSGNLAYALTERTLLDLTIARDLSPSGVGILGRSESAGGSLSHRFSDRLTARVGAGYGRTTFPSIVDSSVGDRTMRGEAGFSYQLAEDWRLDAGYRYTRTKYTQDASRASANVVFVSVGYNWPGANLTGWVGRSTEARSLTGGGALFLPGGGTTIPGLTAPSPEPSSSLQEPQPFDAITLP